MIYDYKLWQLGNSKYALCYSLIIELRDGNSGARATRKVIRSSNSYNIIISLEGTVDIYYSACLLVLWPDLFWKRGLVTRPYMQCLVPEESNQSANVYICSQNWRCMCAVAWLVWLAKLIMSVLRDLVPVRYKPRLWVKTAATIHQQAIHTSLLGKRSWSQKRQSYACYCPYNYSLL